MNQKTVKLIRKFVNQVGKDFSYPERKRMNKAIRKNWNECNVEQRTALRRSLKAAVNGRNPDHPDNIGKLSIVGDSDGNPVILPDSGG